MTVAPDAFQDEDLARRLVEDFSLPERGVLPEGAVSIEAPLGLLLHDLLSKEGWGVGEPWTPLFRDLTEPVEDSGVRIKSIGPEQAQDFADVLRSAFNTSRPTREYWYAMSAGPFYADACCLGAYDDQGSVAAVVTVWSAGPGEAGAGRADGRPRGPPWSRLRPGDHRGRGGRAAGDGLVERTCMHAEFQRRRRRHVQGGRVRGAAGGAGLDPDGLDAGAAR
ncbi:hypothetical protein QFZ24_000373 [Streptomyces phaeochromogenes]|nr:hypothetical protein [Streptomyces phaeochromogenes]